MGSRITPEVVKPLMLIDGQVWDWVYRQETGLMRYYLDG